MIRAILILIVGLIAFSAQGATEQSTPSVDHGVGLSVDWKMLHQGDGGDISVLSPALIKIKAHHSDDYIAELAGIAEVGVEDYPNLAMSSASYQYAGSTSVAFGVRYATFLGIAPSPYIELEALRKFNDPSLASDGWGTLLALGGQLFHYNKGAVIVQADWIQGFGRTDRLTGTPDIFNGIDMRLGFQTYF